MKKLTPSLEDYLEAIWIVSLSKKTVRVKDIAKFLGVRTASVVGAMKILDENGLVDHERYGYIELTRKGEKKAKEIYGKHKILCKFFNEVLGADKGVAAEDACKFEHYISKEILDRIVMFIRFLETCSNGDPRWLSGFRYFVEHGTCPEPCPKRKEGKKDTK